MRFSEYMNDWLYGDEGYYKHFCQIGKEGDFFTSVSTSRFFGAAIANKIYSIISQDSDRASAHLIEIGAHQGHLFCDMIEWLYSCDESLIESMSFGIVERMPHVKKEQERYIKRRLGEAFEVTFYDDISEVEAKDCFFVANEIFDAFGCELYKDKKIAVVEEDKIAWVEAPQTLQEFAKKHRLETGEIAVGYEAFAKSMCRAAKRFDFITFDYGERYVRNDFSIRIYKKHTTWPLFDDEVKLNELYGNSDITYDVNFGHLIDIYEELGVRQEGYSTQAKALIAFGIIDILERYSAIAPYEAYQKEADNIKTLLAPTMLGERFKMLHLSKA